MKPGKPKLLHWIHLKSTLSKDIATLVSITQASGTTVRNMDDIFDQDLSFDSQIMQISIAADFHLCNIAKM